MIYFLPSRTVADPDVCCLFSTYIFSPFLFPSSLYIFFAKGHNICIFLYTSEWGCLQLHCPGYVQLRQASIHLTGPIIVLTAL